MNAKTLTIAFALTTSSVVATPAMAQDSFGYDTLSKCCLAGAQPLGTVVEYDDGSLGVVHVGNLTETTTRTGTSTSIQLVSGDLNDGLVYDFDFAVEPADVSDSMQAFTATSAAEMLGIIIRNSEGEIELEPLGIPVEDDSGHLDIHPVTVTEIAGGVELTTDNDAGLCCWAGTEEMSAATLDADGYVDFDLTGTITLDGAGTVLNATTSTTTSSSHHTSGRR
jgi:hypothetical protein